MLGNREEQGYVCIHVCLLRLYLSRPARSTEASLHSLQRFDDSESGLDSLRGGILSDEGGVEREGWGAEESVDAIGMWMVSGASLGQSLEAMGREGGGSKCRRWNAVWLIVIVSVFRILESCMTFPFRTCVTAGRPQMGLGKTVELLACILSNRFVPQHPAQQQQHHQALDDSGSGGGRDDEGRRKHDGSDPDSIVGSRSAGSASLRGGCRDDDDDVDGRPPRGRRRKRTTRTPVLWDPADLDGRSRSRSRSTRVDPDEEGEEEKVRCCCGATSSDDPWFEGKCGRSVEAYGHAMASDGRGVV